MTTPPPTSTDQSTDHSTDPGSHDHGFTVVSHRRRNLAVGGLAVVLVVALGVWWFALRSPAVSANEIPGATLQVVSMEGQVAEQTLVEWIAENIAPDYGLDIEFRGLSDSTQINRAVSEGQVAATIYQHRLWLAQVLEANPEFRERAAVPVFRWGFGMWSDRYDDPADLPQDAEVSLLADPANEAQGLWLLERAGLIELDPDVDKWQATQDDIVANPKNLQFTLLDFGAQPRALGELDAIVGYTLNFTTAGVSHDHLIFDPPPPDEFAGQLTIGTDFEDTENIQKLIEVFSDPRIQEYLATSPDIDGDLVPYDNSLVEDADTTADTTADTDTDAGSDS